MTLEPLLGSTVLYRALPGLAGLGPHIGGRMDAPSDTPWDGWPFLFSSLDARPPRPPVGPASGLAEGLRSGA